MNPHNSQDPDHLSPERAQRLIELQQQICRLLGSNAVSRVAQIPSFLRDDVRLHVITCEEDHSRIEGLFDDQQSD